eukprot:scaffold1794_cov107-Cylindrotheca_fusiformis.AAC.5
MNSIMREPDDTAAANEPTGDELASSTAGKIEGVPATAMTDENVKDSLILEKDNKDDAKNPIPTDEDNGIQSELEVRGMMTGSEEAPKEPLMHVGSERRSTRAASSQGSSSSRRKWILMVIGCCGICLFLVIVSVVIAFLVVTEDDDDEPSRGVRDEPSASPTQIPTLLRPSIAPTSAASGFRSISKAPGAVRLRDVSSCDDCFEAVAVPGQYFLPWNSLYAVTSIEIESDGSVSLQNEVIGYLSYINVIRMDLAPNDQGNIYLLWEPETGNGIERRQVDDAAKVSITISWENIIVPYGYSIDEPFKVVNAQVKISEGEVRICFGEGDVGGLEFETALTNYTSNGFAPATGDGFSSDGSSNQFPSNTCQIFTDTMGGSTFVPSQSYTSYSPTANTASPTWLPSSDPTKPTYAGFTAISSIPGAVALETVSSCDDCVQTIVVPFKFFLWDGKYSVPMVIVSSNGFVKLSGGCNSVCGRIKVIEMDLDPSMSENEMSVSSFQRSRYEPLIISWEEVPVYDYSNSSISGQVKLHANGRIDVCWGSISLPSTEIVFESNLEDYSDGSFHPATGPAFDSRGKLQQPISAVEFTCQTLLGTNSKVTLPDADVAILTFASAFNFHSEPSRNLPAVPSPLYHREFVYLKDIPGSIRLEAASSLDYGFDVFTVDVPIQWFGGISTDTLLVSSNGRIRIDTCSVCGEILVAVNLDPSQKGDVWFYNNTSQQVDSPVDPEVVYSVSFEDVAVFDYDRSSINAQAHFYSNGTIELCWGPSSTRGQRIRAGLFDARFNFSLPAWGEPFDLSGSTILGEWPTELCQAFYVASSPPTVGPTLFPTFVPTNNET